MAPVRRKGGAGGSDGAKRGGGGGGGKSFWGKAGFEGEVSKNLVDVVCTWVMLAGMVASAAWVEWAVPTFCGNADASDKVGGQSRPCCWEERDCPSSRLHSPAPRCLAELLVLACRF